MTWYLVVGTSHISSQAVRAVKKAFDEFRPDVVAVELDRARLEGLLSGERTKPSLQMIREVGVRGYLFALFGSWLQRKLDDVVGVSPGAEMLAAVRLAKREKKLVLLIDQDILVTLRHLNRALGWPELKRFLKDFWRGLRGKERLALDLSKVPDKATVDSLMAELSSRYPRPYAVLVERRNHHMAAVLLHHHRLHPEQRVMVVVGAGHVKGLSALLEKSLNFGKDYQAE